MPEPAKGEKRQDYISRCMPIVMGEDPNMKPKHAYAKCIGMWEQAQKKKG